MLSLTTDTAISLEAVGITEANAKKKFGEGTDFEVATVDGMKVVHRRSEDEIVYAGKQYLRFRKGRTSIWNSTSDE